MTCTKPVKVYVSDIPMAVRCGKCRACRIQDKKEWTWRLLTEVPYWDASIFLTLTYDDDHLPGGLDHVHVQKFLKRLRKSLQGQRIKYFAVGEYGETTFRPHYHLIIFGYWPDDSRKSQFTDYYESASLTKLWGHGQISFGEVTAASTRYCAGYVQKKLQSRGDYSCVRPPYSHMSKGLGEKYIEENSDRLRKNLCVEIDGFPSGLPRYYKKKLDIPTEVLYAKYEEILKQVDELYKRNGWNPNSAPARFEAERKQKDQDLQALERFQTQRDFII